MRLKWVQIFVASDVFGRRLFDHVLVQVGDQILGLEIEPDRCPGFWAALRPRRF
jgi:hypothetical protein